LNRPPHRQEEDVSLMPLPVQRRNGTIRHRRGSMPRKPRRIVTIGTAIIAVAAIALGITLYNKSSEPTGPLPIHLPPATASYLGVYTKGLPDSYEPITAFTRATGANPDLVMYYSGWYVPFPAGFANTVASHGAVPLVQMDPDHINIANIASGRYDGYLSAYAEAVRAYRHPVILSFGHEMNGNWSSWGYRNTRPAVFVSAWRHIVSLFRALGAQNVTWLWTANIINDSRSGKVDANLRQWWPGSSYVTWVGIDGYYLKPNWQFAPLFGPTITNVRTLTSAPILIAETGAVPAAGQPAKIADLFAGIRSYGLLGFVYFNTTNSVGQPFGISSTAAIAAFSKGASMYHRPES
jgi:mannan endo-1,4-beta-mannosidase